MKTSLKIAFLTVALVAMTGCSAQRRAERMVRRAVNLCPELVQLKAHTIDTVLTAPAFTDMAVVPLTQVLTADTIYAATDHGTVVVSLRQSDSALRVGFVAAPQEVHYRDTLRYRQVAVSDSQAPSAGRRFLSGLALLVFGIGFGLALCLWLLRYALKDNHFTKKQ